MLANERENRAEDQALSHAITSDPGLSPGSLVEVYLWDKTQ